MSSAGRSADRAAGLGSARLEAGEVELERHFGCAGCAAAAGAAAARELEVGGARQAGRQTHRQGDVGPPSPVADAEPPDRRRA